MALEDFVLSVRNGSIFTLVDDKFGENQLELLDAIGEAQDTLVMNGFLRSDIMTLSTPELFFTLDYIVKLKLVDDCEEKFLPYFLSNDCYEQYVFCYERVEEVIKTLAGFLDEDELGEVIANIMYMDETGCNERQLERAKSKLVDAKEKLGPLLERAYAMF